LIRRNNFDGVDVIAINEITLFPDERRVLINNGPINLTSKEFDLLVFITRIELFKKCIGRAPVGDSADQFDNFDFIYNHVKP
jgi:hypothetical protein